MRGAGRGQSAVASFVGGRGERNCFVPLITTAVHCTPLLAPAEASCSATTRGGGGGRAGPRSCCQPPPNHVSRGGGRLWGVVSVVPGILFDAKQ